MTPARMTTALQAQVDQGEAILAKPVVTRDDHGGWFQVSRELIIACFGKGSGSEENFCSAFTFLGLVQASADEYRDAVRKRVVVLRGCIALVGYFHGPNVGIMGDVSRGTIKASSAEHDRRQQLRDLREQLAAMPRPEESADWPSVTQWAESARPLVPEGRIGDFERSVAEPEWYVTSRTTTWGRPFNNVPLGNAHRPAQGDAENREVGAKAVARVLAFIDGLPPVANDPDPQKGGPMSTIKIFISHAQPDHVVAKAFAHMIEGALVVPDGAIRCTSVDGYRLSPGDHGSERLRTDIVGCDVLVGLITEKSIASGYVVMELGAAWVLQKTTCAVLAPGVEFSRIPGPLVERHAIRWDRAADLALLVDAIATATTFAKRGADRQRVAIDDFLASPSTAISAPPIKPSAVPPLREAPLTDGEATIMLKGWLERRDVRSGVPHRFSAIDQELSLPHGATQRLLAGVVESYPFWGVDASGDLFRLFYSDPRDEL